VIDVQVGEHDALDVGGANADRSELRPGLLLRLDVEAHAQAEVRAPARQALQGRGRARIDQDDAVAMFDRVAKVGSQADHSASINGARRRLRPWPRPTIWLALMICTRPV